MSNLFIFTACNADAKRHIVDTIDNPIPAEKVEKHFTGDELLQVRKIGVEHGYYAWGATPGERNIPNWEKISQGDHFLIYQDGAYTYYAKVLFKAHNKAFALDNWGKDGNDETWEYMYFLQKPTKLLPSVKTSVLSKYLPESYQGFGPIKYTRILDIIKDHGSLEGYLSEVLPITLETARKVPNFWWVNQGHTYDICKKDGFIWAPNKDKGGNTPRHWQTLHDVRANDVIFSYADGSIKAILAAKGVCKDYKNKWEETSWGKDGQRIDVEFYELNGSIKLSTIQPHVNEINPKINSDNSPFNNVSGIKQGYLFNFSFDSAKIIRNIYGKPFPEPIEKYFTGLVSTTKQDEGLSEVAIIGKKKQIILYGPPGTGKTYYTKGLALSILKGA